MFISFSFNDFGIRISTTTTNENRLTILSSFGIHFDAHGLCVKFVDQTDVLIIRTIFVSSHDRTMHPVRPIDEVAKHRHPKNVRGVRNNDLSVTPVKVC